MIMSLKQKWSNIPLTVKVSTSYAVCSILQRCLSFITLPLFTRLLTKEEFGEYTIYSSWSGILIIFLTLNLAYGSFQTAMVKFEEKRAEYISSIQGICLVLSGLFLIIYIPFRNLWNQLFELPTFFVLLMVSEIIFSTSTQLWMGRNRFEFKYKSVVTLTMGTSILSPLAAYILVSWTEQKGYARIVGYAGINILIGIIIFILNIKRGKHLYNKSFWKYAFSFNIPLLAYYLSQVIFNQSDRIMISHFCGKGDAALYGVAYNFAMILSFVMSAINNSYVPWLYGKIKDNDGEKNKKISVSLAILLALMILCIIWYAPEIIHFMAGEQYFESIYVVAPVAMSLLLLFYCQFFINVEFYYEEKKFLVYGSIGAAILNIVLNYFLIPVFGFVVAGYTTLLSYIVFAVSNCITMKKVIKKRGLQDNLYNYKALCFVFLIFSGMSALGVVLYNQLVIRIIITLAVFIGIIIFRNKFIFVLLQLKEKNNNDKGKNKIDKSDI